MPSSYLAPGVYMEEVSSGSRPIEAVGTAVAAFVGFAEKGPANEPVLVTSWTQFKRSFGDFVDGYYLAHAVYGYFLNGGGTAYVVRVGEAALPAGGADVVSAGDYVGNSADRTGFGGLEAIDNVTMLCVPDLMAAYQHGKISLDDVKAVQLAMIAHCELMADRVAILDT